VPTCSPTHRLSSQLATEIAVDAIAASAKMTYTITAETLTASIAEASEAAQQINASAE
jgi:hypothetical protein